jgi:hypothetical protein
LASLVNTEFGSLRFKWILDNDCGFLFIRSITCWLVFFYSQVPRIGPAIGSDWLAISPFQWSKKRKRSKNWPIFAALSLF